MEKPASKWVKKAPPVALERPAEAPAPAATPEPAKPSKVAALANAHGAQFCKFLPGSFSAVSKRNFERKHRFDSSFQGLQDLHTFAPLQS